MTPLETLYFPICQKAAGEVNLDPTLLLALCWRESGYGTFLIPKGPSGTGDGGHGRGLWQIDDRTWGLWLEENNWQDPLTNCRKACSILADDFANLKDLAATVCAYNAGPRRAAQMLATVSPGATDAQKYHCLDKVTTDMDYVTAVMTKFQGFQSIPSNS